MRSIPEQRRSLLYRHERSRSFLNPEHQNSMYVHIFRTFFKNLNFSFPFELKMLATYVRNRMDVTFEQL
jgi:hypothetical protein